MLKAVNTVVKATGWDNEMVGIVISGVAIIVSPILPLPVSN
jgi:hypothetical protein